MAEQWASRIRDTNALVRALAGYILRKRSVSPDQLYGLCKLTWITESFLGDAPAYIRSTKIPALGDIFNEDFDGFTLDEVAKKIARITRSEKIRILVLQHSGFTNLYKSYRNSSRGWIAKNHKALLPLFRAAYRLESDKSGLAIIRQVEKLPGIPKAKNASNKMQAAYLLTPVLASLDRRQRFPLINGNQGVQSVLRALKVREASLSDKYEAMVRMYGQGGICDSADLDQVGSSLVHFLSIGGTTANRTLLAKQPTSGASLKLKDEADVKTVRRAGSITQTRKHNAMTNHLLEALANWTVAEGDSKAAMFDALVTNYDLQGNDLLIEVKSTCEDGDVRMAIGQLYSYSHRLGVDKKRHLALLLPIKPALHVCELLAWRRIGLLWFSGTQLQTVDRTLSKIAQLG